MRREWTRLERGDTTGAWRNSQATFLAQVVGPHFEGICRDWAPSAEDDVFGSAPDDPGRPRRVLSLGEATWNKAMNTGHPERLRRARDLLAVKGYDTSGTKLTCYSGAGFDPDLAAGDPAILLVGLEMLYS
jgi:hypothetical protein